MTLNDPAKGSNPRQMRISPKIIDMISPLIPDMQANVRIWNTDIKYISDSYRKKRNSLSKLLGNPRLKQITFKSLRHFKGSTEYAKTKDIFHVKNVLGHVNIQNTMVYIHILGEEPEENYIIKVCTSLDEFIDSLSHGFEYVTDYNDFKIVRKRK